MRKGTIFLVKSAVVAGLAATVGDANTKSLLRVRLNYGGLKLK